MIKELDAGFALPKLILSKFCGNEAALNLAVVSYNLVVIFSEEARLAKSASDGVHTAPLALCEGWRALLGSHARKRR